MKAALRIAVVALGALLAAVSVASAAPRAATTIMISIDGFRASYLDRGVTPALSALAADGVRSSLRPSFPSVTFPNHFTLVTGLYPDHHGIVANHFEDPELGRVFDMTDVKGASDPSWWTGGAPIWATATAAGVTPAIESWPSFGGGGMPALYEAFDPNRSMAAEVDRMLSWLDLPPARRPRLVLGYFYPVDHAGHEFGPDSPQVAQVAGEADAAIGRLVAGLKARGMWEQTNLIVVADHGMAETSRERTIALDDMVDVNDLRVVTSGPLAGLAPVGGRESRVEGALLGRHGHMACWRKAALPERFHYGTNARIPPILCLAEVGWIIDTRAKLASAKAIGGAHGYDPDDATMAALFVAHGPSFRPGVVLPKFDNVDVYPMLARLLGVKPVKNDGQLKDVAKALR